MITAIGRGVRLKEKDDPGLLIPRPIVWILQKVESPQTYQPVGYPMAELHTYASLCWRLLLKAHFHMVFAPRNMASRD